MVSSKEWLPAGGKLNHRNSATLGGRLGNFGGKGEKAGGKAEGEEGGGRSREAGEGICWFGRLAVWGDRLGGEKSPVASLDRQFSAGPAGPPRPSSDYPSRPPPPEAMPIIEPGDPVPVQGGRAAGEGDEGAWVREPGRMLEVFGAIREHRIDTVGREQVGASRCRTVGIAAGAVGTAAGAVVTAAAPAAAAAAAAAAALWVPALTP
ncbi:unnamed protein product [Closterium sp. NIES-64]|nr:unnamed protein product [Closterium sp. NIES-64]